jgi:serine/threonine protein kinase
MGWRERLGLSSPTPITAALENEVARLEKLVLFGWLGTSAIVLLINLATIFLVRGFAGASLLFSLGFGLWFSLVLFLTHKNRGRFLRLWINPAIESALPWASLLILTSIPGAAYALGSWLPPMLFACVMCGGILRLRPVVPLLVGTLGALQYVLAYALFVRRQLTFEEFLLPLYGSSVQVVRTGTILLGGVLASALSMALRRALGNAATVVRARDLFGKYRIERSIASGGMATVFAATYCPEGGFERPVAIKRIHPHLARLPSFVDGFRNEAELCARLVHPNVVQVFDFGRVEETYFLAMEFVDGVTLSTIMRAMRETSTHVSSALVAWVGRQMLEGLAYSHSGARDRAGGVLRVVHRDICPSNVLVSRNGEIKLSDFGLARALRSARAYTTESLVGHLTYMAPEQATGHEMDERSDLFAVGVVLWELLTGTPLFKREFEGATILAIVKDAVPRPSTLRADLGASWDELFDRALDRDPTRRFQSAREMAESLAAVASHVEVLDETELTRIVARVMEDAKLRHFRDEMPTAPASHPEEVTGSLAQDLSLRSATGFSRAGS